MQSFYDEELHGVTWRKPIYVGGITKKVVSAEMVHFNYDAKFKIRLTSNIQIALNKNYCLSTDLACINNKIMLMNIEIFN